MEYNVEHNPAKQRFEVQLDGAVAIVAYELFDGGIAFMHTEVPEAFEGRGIAGAMAKHVLDFAAVNQFKVKPYCPFILAYIDRHPQYWVNSLFHNRDGSHKGKPGVDG